MRSRFQNWARAARREAVVVSLAARDPRVPRGVKILALAVAVYAFSPIDLIPDFIPVLGHLDDVILIPVGVLLVVRLIPRDVLADLRRKAERRGAEDRPRAAAGAAAVLGVWLLAAVLVWVAVSRS